MNLGQTFIPALPQGDGHLWVVISDPTPQSRIAIVNFTTKRPGCDESCIVQPGEHPFFVRESVVFYARSRLQDVDSLERHLSIGNYQPREPVSTSLLRRVQDGALASPFTSGVVQISVRATLGLA